MSGQNDSSLDLQTLFRNLNLSESNHQNYPSRNLTQRLPLNETQPSNKLEVTYINPNVHNWNQVNLQATQKKRLHRRNVPGFRRFYDDSFLLKQNFLAKLDWYKRLNYKRARIQPKSESISSRRLWNVYSAPSRDWMMSGDCKDSLKMQRRRERNYDFQISIPIITNSGNQKWLEVSIKEVEVIVKNLKTKSCFRIKQLIFQKNQRYFSDEE
ncbi:hypothetical protein Trydic_g9194 [Trypoxylus dichotomus]